MLRLVQIENGVVVNASVGYQELDGWIDATPFAIGDKQVSIGWLYDGQTFSPPPPPEPPPENP